MSDVTASLRRGGGSYRVSPSTERSLCLTGAFVNYLSDIHLQHAIAVSNGVSLRPHDYRCKDLVCRVRKGDEEKSGVGAQRIGGMHVTYVAEKRALERTNRLEMEKLVMDQHLQTKSLREQSRSREPGEPETTGERPLLAEVPMGEKVSSGTRSNGIKSFNTTSTTSSFLTRHFPKRYFILKVSETTAGSRV